MNMYSGQKSKKKTIIICILVGLSLTAIIALIGVYLYGENYYSKHFLKGTVINDIDVSKMTVQELNARVRQYNLEITERTSDGEYVKEVITGDEVGLEINSMNRLDTIFKNQKNGKWIGSKGANYTIEDFVKYDENYFKESMKFLKCFSAEFVVKPQDAKISEYNTETKSYELQEEIQGNAVDKKKVKKLISQHILELNSKLDLEKEDCYKKPNITKEDESLNALIDKLNQYVNVSITYTFGDQKEVVDGNLINQWIQVDDEQNIILDTNYVDEYVASLRKKYDTIFRPRKFQTSYGKEISLSKGDYGWWMNYQQESKELAEMIQQGQSGERTPVYRQTAAQYGENDYGDTYIEVNLTAQHVFFYKDGELVFETDCVSGNSSKGNSTREGVYGITYMQRNATLKGEDYETPVSYWMPFDGNIGLHDATWRGEFGSEIYKSTGSHGCINLPYKIAKDLYGYVKQGTPVIVYKLKGTKSDHITIQTDEEIAQSAIDRINEIQTVTRESEKVIERARVVYNELTPAQRKYVTNYKKLVAAEKKYKELTGK